jgi:hypothetical protein
MTLPALVLVHGGGHAADCWDLPKARHSSESLDVPRRLAN